MTKFIWTPWRRLAYPKTFGIPVWFMIPELLSEPICRAMLGTNGAVAEAVIDTLREMHVVRA